MRPVTKETLAGICAQMAAHGWREAEIGELVQPRLGIITGFQALLDELEVLRQTDLRAIAPAQGVQRAEPAGE